MDSYSIVFVVYSLRGGGAERVVSKLTNYLSKSHSVTILLLSKTPSFYLIAENIKVISPNFGKPNGFKLFYFLRLAKYIRSNLKKLKPDGVFVFGESITSFVLLASIGLKGKKYLSNRASPFSNLKGFRGMVNPKVYPLADGVVVQTAKAVEVLKKHYKKTKFFVIGNPVTQPKHTPSINSKPKMIVNVGFLGGRKNQTDLIRTFASIEDKDEWKLYFLGDGPDKSKLIGLTSKLNLTDKVIFAGAVKNVDDYLQQAQIFAFTSLSEGFPNALAEAMAHGCACISYDISTGPSEMIEDGKNGFLIPEADNELYKKKLGQLMGDEGLKRQFSLNAKLKMNDFELSSIAEKYTELISTDK